MSRAYAEGRDAAHQGYTLDDNPYMPPFADYQRWIDGWKDAMQPDDDERAGGGPL